MKLHPLPTQFGHAWSVAERLKRVKLNQSTSHKLSQRLVMALLTTLHPELTAKIKTAFWTYAWDENFKKEFKKADRFIGITHKFDWSVIRGIDRANGVSYDCK